MGYVKLKLSDEAEKALRSHNKRKGDMGEFASAAVLEKHNLRYSKK